MGYPRYVNRRLNYFLVIGGGIATFAPMRQTLTCLGFVLLVSAACSSESTPTASSATNADAADNGMLDGSSSTNNSAEEGGVSTEADADSDCSNLMLNDVPKAQVDALFKVLGIWQADQQVSNGKHTPLTGCDTAFAYRIGPEVIIGDSYKYVECTLKRGALMKMSAGPYKVPAGGCADFGCTGKFALLWSSETGGSVFQLDENEKPKGPAVLSVTLGTNGTESELLFSNGSGLSGTGYIHRPGDATALKCQ